MSAVDNGVPWWQEAIEAMTLGGCSERDSGISEHMLEEEESEQFENKMGLSRDLRFLAGMPELCDVMFLVGEEREAMYGVKAVLAIRSRVFYKMLYGPKSAVGSKHKITTAGSSSTGLVLKLHKMLAEASPLRHSIRTANNNHKTVVCIEDFEPDVFKQLLEFIHTGNVTLYPRTLLGLMNAADHFAIEDLRRACADFSHHCIKLETVCSLLVTAEKYIQYKSTKIFVQRVLEFVDSHGEEVLRLGELVHLPRHVVELILSREDLSASELTKFRAVERWSRHYILYFPDESLCSLIQPFVHYISFQLIPTQIIMREIRPLGIVPDHLLMTALAYQADPSSVSQDSALVPLSSSPDLVSLTPRSRSRARLFQLCSSTTTSPVSTERKNLSKSRSVDRHLSKCSTGSSGYDSAGVHEEMPDELMMEQWSSSGRTILRIEPLEDQLAPVAPKSRSVSDLSSHKVQYKL